LKKANAETLELKKSIVFVILLVYSNLYSSYKINNHFVVNSRPERPTPAVLYSSSGRHTEMERQANTGTFCSILAPRPHLHTPRAPACNTSLSIMATGTSLLFWTGYKIM